MKQHPLTADVQQLASKVHEWLNAGVEHFTNKGDLQQLRLHAGVAQNYLIALRHLLDQAGHPNSTQLR